MDTNQNQNEGDYEALQENMDSINPAILNTPAEEPKNIRDLLPDVDPDTFIEFNKPGRITPDTDVVLDLGGEKSKIDTSSEKLGTESKYLEKIFGEDFGVEEAFNSSAVILVMVIVVVIFFFIMFSLKRAEQINHLEKEVDKLKKKNLGA